MTVLQDGTGPPDRKTETVRRLLRDAPRPPVPVDLAQRAAGRGERLLRQRAVRRALWLLLLVALITLLVWVAGSEPWLPPPAETSPPSDYW